MRWEKVNIVALCSPPTKRSHWPHPGAWGEQMRKTSKNLSLEWNGNVTCFQTSQQWAQFPQVCKPPLQGRFPSLNHILLYFIIHIPYIYKLTKTKGESNCQTSFDAINLYILHLSTTSCQYWVAKPIRAQQEEKSATHLHQISLGSGKSIKRERSNWNSQRPNSQK